VHEREPEGGCSYCKCPDFELRMASFGFSVEIMHSSHGSPSRQFISTSKYSRAPLRTFEPSPLNPIVFSARARLRSNIFGDQGSAGVFGGPLA